MTDLTTYHTQFYIPVNSDDPRKNPRLKSETRQGHEKIQIELMPFNLTLNGVPPVTEMEDLYVGIPLFVALVQCTLAAPGDRFIK
jgi:hypothetical protein